MNPIAFVADLNINCLFLAWIQDTVTAEGLAFDWVGKKLYWADVYMSRIYSMKLNSSSKVTLAIVPSPRAVAVHPCKGYVHFFEFF